MAGLPDGIFNQGTDHSIKIFRTDTGARIFLDGQRSKFSSSNPFHVLESNTIDMGGDVLPQLVNDKVTGSIEVERANAQFDAFMLAVAANNRNGLPTIYCGIYEKIYDAGRQTFVEYRYTNVVFHNHERGTYERTSKVMSSVQFTATAIIPA